MQEFAGKFHGFSDFQEEEKMYKETAKELLEFIEKSPSCFHAVKTMKDMLDMEGFEEIKEADKWE